MSGDGPKEFEAERVRPGREPNLESDVMTPVLSTFVVLVFSLALSAYFAWLNGWRWHVIIPISLVVSGVYFVGYTRLLNRTLWITERVLHVDLDGDGEIGEPVTELSAVIEQEDGYTKVVRDKFGLSSDVVRQWAKDATMKKTIAINAWTGDGGLFTRAEYENFLDRLNQMGFAENPSGKKWQLTPTGHRYFTNLLRS